MNRMRKGFAALVAACLLFAGGGKAQAVLGIPDDVPANTLLFPFFKVNPSRDATHALDTLLVVTNTANLTIFVHFTLWTVKSVHVYDFNVKLTPHDVFSCSLFDILLGPGCTAEGVAQAPPSAVTDLAFGALLAGYVTADVVDAATFLFPGQAGYPLSDENILVGHEYIVDLPQGSATGLNAVSIEHAFPSAGHPAVDTSGLMVFGFYTTRCLEEQPPGACPSDALERIDGSDGELAQTGLDFDGPLSLIVRYFSASALFGRTELWLWKDRNTTGAAASVNIAVYDEAEHVHSITLPLKDEVNFKDVKDIITPGVNGGWFRIKFPCTPFGCDVPAYTSSSKPDIQAVAYSLQFANSQDATLRWDAVFPAHRQYSDYIGGVSEE